MFWPVEVGVAATDNLLVPCTDFEALSAASEANFEVVVACFKGTTVNFNRIMTVVTLASTFSYCEVGSICSAASIH